VANPTMRRSQCKGLESPRGSPLRQLFLTTLCSRAEARAQVRWGQLDRAFRGLSNGGSFGWFGAGPM